jgi:transcriptional regulator with XRE-family HTH domain
VGARISQLRLASGLTLEKLAYECDMSKGFLSDVENGLALPSLLKLAAIAERLEVDLLDLVTFPKRSDRQKLVDEMRGVRPELLRRWLREAKGESGKA